MFKKVFIGFVLLSFPVLAAAQDYGETTALKHLKKTHFRKAYSILERSMLKDSTSVPAHYLMSQYFFSPQNPDFQIDSAHQYIQRAINLWTRMEVKVRDKLKRYAMDSANLIRYRSGIDSAAFERAKIIHSLPAYQAYLTHFSYSGNRHKAEELRNDVAFDEALLKNTFQAYKHYTELHPRSIHYNVAKKLYDRLLYEYKTSNQQLSSFIEFLKEYPETPHRIEAEKNIYQLSTSSGNIAAFQDFLIRYPDSKFFNQGRNILYHLLLEDHESSLPPRLLNDSLLTIIHLSQRYLIPFLHKGKFGFMTEDGIELVEANQEEIIDEYSCGNITEDIIVLNDRIISRNGVTIWREPPITLDDLGYGFLKIETQDGFAVVHKSGLRVIDEFVEDVTLLNGKFLACKKQGKWGLVTLTGKLLLPYQWDDITSTGHVIILKQNQKLNLVTVGDIVHALHSKKLHDGFDEVKKLPNALLWVRSGDFQGILTEKLDILVKLEKHTLTPVSSGFLALSSSGHYTLFSNEGRESEYVDKIESQGSWLGFKKNKTWRLFDPMRMQYASKPYDSVQFLGSFAIGITQDSLHVFTENKHQLSFASSTSFEFLPGQDSTSYLLVNHGTKKSVFTKEGINLFTVMYDKIQYAGNGFFIVHKKEKKGLVDTSGKTILPVTYDAIGSPKDQMISLLRAMKFGLYNYQTKKLIQPEYDKNIATYNSTVFTSFKQHGYGFFDLNNKALSKFEFDEINYWQDSVALVKKNNEWKLFNFYTGYTIVDHITSVKFVKDSDDEKVVILKVGGAFGVVSNRKGIIIPFNFTDLVNVGSAEKPTYFTEKHVEEASLYVVIYYNYEGKFLRREVYEQDEYERIYCAQKL